MKEEMEQVAPTAVAKTAPSQSRQQMAWPVDDHQSPSFPPEEGSPIVNPSSQGLASRARLWPCPRHFC